MIGMYPWMYLGKKYGEAPLKDRLRVAWLAIKGSVIPEVTKLVDKNADLENKNKRFKNLIKRLNEILAKKRKV